MNLRAVTAPLAALTLIATALYSESITAIHDPPGPIHVTYWEKWTEFEADAMRAEIAGLR